VLLYIPIKNEEWKGRNRGKGKRKEKIVRCHSTLAIKGREIERVEEKVDGGALFRDVWGGGVYK